MLTVPRPRPVTAATSPAVIAAPLFARVSRTAVLVAPCRRRARGLAGLALSWADGRGALLRVCAAGTDERSEALGPPRGSSEPSARRSLSASASSCSSLSCMSRRRRSINAGHPHFGRVRSYPPAPGDRRGNDASDTDLASRLSVRSCSTTTARPEKGPPRAPRHPTSHQPAVCHDRAPARKTLGQPAPARAALPLRPVADIIKRHAKGARIDEQLAHPHVLRHTLATRFIRRHPDAEGIAALRCLLAHRAPRPR